MTVQQKSGLVAALRDAAGQLVAQNLSKYTEYVNDQSNCGKWPGDGSGCEEERMAAKDLHALLVG